MPLLSVEEALNQVVEGVTPLRSETLPISEAAGRILAEPVKANLTQPPFNTTSMDGYAVRAEDVAAKEARLTVIGESAAGKRYAGAVSEGQAVRVFTGAPLPPGSDTVIIQENTRREDDIVTVVDGDRHQGQCIRPRGLDFNEGDVILPKGMRLSARHIGIAASGNNPTVSVTRKPKVALLSTGSELVLPGRTPNPDQIVSSNGLAAAALVEAAGGTALDFGIVEDNKGVMTARVSEILDAKPDVFVTSGGASVGDHDLVQIVLAELGMQLGFWRIAMRPGKPLMFGTLAQTRFLGLPGNPVSSLVCARLFLWPLIKALLGENTGGGEKTAILDAPMPANDKRQDYVRAKFTPAGHVTPFPKQDSSMLSVLVKADCLIIRPPFAPAVEAGSRVAVLPLDF